MHTRLIWGENWVIPFIAVAVPCIGWRTLSAASLPDFMQVVLLALYALQLIKLRRDRRLLTLQHSVQRGIASEEARVYFVRLRTRYLSSGIKVLAYTMVVNVLVAVIEPHNQAQMLWLLMAPIACFSLVSLRLILCHRSVEAGTFTTPELASRELAEYLLRKSA